MKKFTKYTKGFTLIELLVVIAIIGILSSVVLVSLNTARQKGKDGRIQAEVSQLRTQLEANYNGTGYPDLVGGASNLAATTSTATNFSLTAADIITLNGGPTNGKLNTGTASVSTGVTVFTEVTSGTPTKYSIYAGLTNGGYFCIGSNGQTKTGTGNFPVVTANFDICQ